MTTKIELSRRVGKAFSTDVFRSLLPSELSEIRKAVVKADKFSDLDAEIRQLIIKAESR